MGAAGDPAACDGAPMGCQRRVASVSAAHEVGLEGCTAWPGKAAPMSSSSRSDRGGRNERQTERERASARAACARTWRAHVSSSATARGRGVTCIRGARAPRTVSKAFLTASGKAFSPRFPRFPGLFRKLAAHARATCEGALRRQWVVGEVLWRVRGALGADVKLAGRAASPRRAPFLTRGGEVLRITSSAESRLGSRRCGAPRRRCRRSGRRARRWHTC